MTTWPNYRAPLDAALRFCFNIGRYWCGASEHGCSVAAQLGRPMCAGVRATPF